MAEALHSSALGVLADPGAALLALETAQTRIAGTMKIISETEWPRETDYDLED